MNTYVYKLNGQPLGFIRDNKLYDFYGKALGWRDGDFMYNKQGQFGGRVYIIAGNHYIIKFLLDLQPLPQQPKHIADLQAADINTTIPPNVNNVELPPGYMDGFA